jgi:hypothetical protein
MDLCEECDFTYDEQQREPVGVQIRHESETLLTVLAGDPLLVRRRPALETWSALEYACHVRDVLLAQRERLYLALVEDEPSFAPIYRDRRAVIARYNASDPARVSTEVAVAAALFVDAFTDLSAAQRERTCIYNYPLPTVRAVSWLGLHMLHECRHHVLDARRSLEPG